MLTSETGVLQPPTQIHPGGACTPTHEFPATRLDRALCERRDNVIIPLVVKIPSQLEMTIPHCEFHRSAATPVTPIYVHPLNHFQVSPRRSNINCGGRAPFRPVHV
jgi:hypothetical protein